jgi:hypothetical protein
MSGSIPKRRLIAAAVFTVTAASLTPTASQTLTGGTPATAKPQRTSGPRQPVPDDTSGFVQIFDGKSLSKWEGDPMFWRAENGAIVGESTAEKPLKQNTFIIWRGGTTKDFELKLDFKLTGGNSGVQYRSAALPDAGKFVLKGYQADMDAKDMYTGMLYEERGRGFLAERGRVTRIMPGGERKLIGSPGEGEALKAAIRPEDWNQLHIIARGSTVVHVINGRVMSLCIDDDTQSRPVEGLLGLQLHTGPAMKAEFRSIFLKALN